MNWEKYWDAIALSKAQLTQVGRVNAPVENTIGQAAEHIAKVLELLPGHQILDICCGNGLITTYLANKGFRMTGVDISRNLIEQAKNANRNINFLQQDALSLSLNEKFDRQYIAFSFQYFDTYKKGEKVLQNMIQLARPGALIMLADVPDLARWGVFYNTVLKKLFYFKQKIMGTQSMGKFWSKKELDSICASIGVQGECLKQPTSMPYSYYRFDYLIRIPV